MLKVLTVGVFDYFHYGHLKLFQQIKDKIEASYLIVAVQEGEYIKKYKKDADIYYSTEIRMDFVKSLKCVDEVVSYQDVETIVKGVDFDVFAIGEDQKHSGFKNVEEYCIKNGKQILYLKRTPNISSSLIKERLRRLA